MTNTGDGAFSRSFVVERLRSETAVAIEADAEEREAVASAFGLVQIETLALKGALSPWSRRGWRFDGALTAKLAQPCVVTLDPVPQSIEEPVHRLWSPNVERSEEPAREIDVDWDEEAAPDPLPEAIDLGAVAIEALALALDPYPRSAEAMLETARAGPPGAEPLTDEAMKPFAQLAALRGELADAPASDDAPGGEAPKTPRDD